MALHANMIFAEMIYNYVTIELSPIRKFFIANLGNNNRSNWNDFLPANEKKIIETKNKKKILCIIVLCI
jgi:hypothetical protein